MKILFFLLSFMSGMSLATQVAINNKLRTFVGSPLLSSFFSFIVGSLGLAVAYLIAISLKLQPVPTLSDISQTSSWMWLGGLFGSFYIFTTIVASPQIGFANMFSLVVTGQIILAVIIDHYGLLGSAIHEFNLVRGIGVLLLVVGLYIVQTH